MKKITLIFTMAAALLSFASCKSAEQMAKDAENVIVKCNPSPLVVKGGKIDADLTVTYPKDYFNKKAVLEVTPVIVYAGGEEKGAPIMFQGEKVENNYRVVPAAGSTVNQHVSFPYVEGMAVCHLELRGRCTTNAGKKWVTLPTKKVADGANITETLASKSGVYSLKDHEYQPIIYFTPEGQVMYKMNSSEVRSSELRSQSVKDFQATVKEMAANERTQVKGIDVVAYASPDGKEDFNNKLSDNRSKSASKAFNQVKKGQSIDNVPTNVKSVGEDWEGFQEMVNKSNIQDKDLILRVLSMYNDPNVREREIRNMSSIYKDLADDVLPQLRRARFIANVEYTNYTDEELQTLMQENADVLDEPALLKAATLCKDSKDKKALYNKAVQKYNSKKAVYNLACVALDDNDMEAFKAQIAKCDKTDADVINLLGVAAMREGDMGAAETYFKASNTADAVKNLGTCELVKGNYAEAAAKCGDKGPNAALANLLSGNTDKALACVKDCTCPTGSYIRAIVYNRQGKVSQAKEELKKATDACSKLAERATTDIEFANL